MFLLAMLGNTTIFVLYQFKVKIIYIIYNLRFLFNVNCELTSLTSMTT